MTIILYSAKGSNSAQRVEWVLNYKAVHYRRVEVSSRELATTYLTINPFGYVPALSIDGLILSESMAIIEYIEQRFAQNSLLGESIGGRASVRRIYEYVNSTIHSAQNRTVLNFLRPELDSISKRRLRGEWISKCLSGLHSELCLDSGFAVGTRFSLADIFVALIYKKTLQYGSHNLPFYDTHLRYIRNFPLAKQSEPMA